MSNIDTRQHHAPRDLFIKAMASRIISIDRRGDIASIARNLYPQVRGIVEAACEPANIIRRSVTNPASSQIAGWAAELTGGTVVADVFTTLAPSSTYAKLSALGVRVDMSGVGLANVPSWGTVASGGAFIGEGQAIGVRQFNMAGTTMDPHLAGIIALFTAEIAGRSTPSIEALLRAGIEATIWAEIDTILLGSAAGNEVQPKGIFNAALTVPPKTGGGLAAMSADLGALVSAVAASGPIQKPTLLLNSADGMRAMTLATGLNSDQLTVIISPYLPAGTVGFLDAGAFASAAGDEVDVSVSKDATVGSLNPGVPLVDSGGVKAKPSTSLFQVDCYGVRIVTSLSWTIDPKRIASSAGITW